MKNALLHDGLEYWRREAPERTALVLGDEAALSYGDLGRWSDGVAAMLASIGVSPGDNVAITGANSIEWVVAAFGILKSGGVIVPLNERFVRDEMDYLVTLSQPRAIIADAPRADILHQLGAAAPIIAMEAIGDYRAGAPGWTAPRVSSDSLAMIMFTSGTTGRPKGVMIAHGEHLTKYYELRLMDSGFGPATKQLMTVSLQSGAGTAWGYLFTTTNGGTFCFMRRFDPELALRMLVEQKITFFPTFPIVLEQLSRQPLFVDADLSAIVTAHVGGARVPAALLSVWRDKGVLLRQMYGQTEIGGYAIIGSDKEVRAGRQTCGRPMIFTRVRVVRGDGSDCGPNEPGEVLVKGPGMMIGYWRDPEGTARTVVDGWTHTGDLGAFDDEGYFAFVDRVKDMIITGGFNVSPSEVEAVIALLPGIVEVAVIPVPDEKFGETPAACVYAVAPIEVEAIIAHCRDRLAGFKCPRYVFQHDEPLPRMSSSKINKRLLAETYANPSHRAGKASR